MPKLSGICTIVRRQLLGADSSICHGLRKPTACGVLAVSIRAFSASRSASRGRKPPVQALSIDEQTKKGAAAFDLSQTLRDLKTSELQRIGRLIGVVFSGTKVELLDRIDKGLTTPKLDPNDDPQDALSSFGPSGDGHRILSIDMGIRNLAFCRLLVGSSAATTRLDRPREDQAGGHPKHGQDPATFVPFGLVTIEDWNHLPLYEQSPASLAVGATDAVQKFTPEILAGWALYILETLVLKAPGGPPSTVLIEKQRWRSGGFSAVQEWTIRVNSLEAMLWMGLRVLQNNGQWKGQVHAVDPGVVTRFWVDKETEDKLIVAKVPSDQDSEAPPKAMKKSEASKAAKVEVARGWIRSGTTRCEDDRETQIELQQPLELPHQKLQFTDATKDLSERFYWKTERQAVRKQAGIDEAKMNATSMGKRNDLADCLLQGVAWIKWEQNRRAINSGQAMLAPEKVSTDREAVKESKGKAKKVPKTPKA